MRERAANKSRGKHIGEFDVVHERRLSSKKRRISMRLALCARRCQATNEEGSSLLAAP